MKRIGTLFGIICTVLLTVHLSFGQTAKNLTQLGTQNDVIRNETTPGANTRGRIADMYKSIFLSSPNIFESYTDPSWLTLTFPGISGKPTTIGGYGITDFNSLGDARWLQSSTLGTGVSTWLTTPSWANFNSAITGTAPFWNLAGNSTLGASPTLRGDGTQTLRLGQSQIVTYFPISSLQVNASASIVNRITTSANVFTASTTLNASGFEIRTPLNTSNGLTIQPISGQTYVLLAGDIITTTYGQGGRINLTTQGTTGTWSTAFNLGQDGNSNSDANRLSFTMNKDAVSRSFNLSSNQTNGTYTDAGSGGIVYAADYSANYTTRSLVDKAYVDASPSPTLTTARTIGITTGDVTSAGSSFDGSANNTNALTIANDAVTYAKMQNVSAASRLLGRGDSGSGDTQELTLGTNLSITGTTLNASGGGTVTNVSSANANATVATQTTTPVITIVNSPAVGGITITGTPSVGQTPIATSGTAATWQTPASGFADPMTTRGDLIFRNASNTTARLGRGTANQVLTSDGTDLSWATPSGGGGWATTGATALTGAVDIQGTTTNTIKYSFPSLGTTLTDGAGLWLQNTTAAASGLQQISPMLTLEGRGWKTNATAASQPVKTSTYVLPVQGTINPTLEHVIAGSINGAAYGNMARFVYDGTPGSTNFFTGLLEINNTNSTATTLLRGNRYLDFTTSSGPTGATWQSNFTSPLGGISTAGGIARFLGTFTRSSGTNEAQFIKIQPTINTTSTYVGTGIAVDIDPVLTSTTGYTNLVFRTTSGQTLLNGTTVTAATTLDVRGISGGSIHRLASNTDTERFDFLTDGGVEIGGNVGTSGQVITSAGAGSPVTWTSPSAATLTTPRTIGITTGDVTSAGSSFNGSANNTNALTIANAVVGIAKLSATGTPSATTFLRGDNTWTTPSGSGDMILANAQTNTGAKTFNNATLLLRNVANSFNGSFTNTNTADRIYTLKDAAGTIAFTSDITGTNSGTNTGDQTITLTGGVTGSGTGSFAATVVTNANLTGVVTSTGNATAIANSAITNAMLANAAVANLTNTNSGNDAVNSLYSSLVSNATHTGDVTGATSLTIANDAVTYAKMQNVSAASRLLGRGDSGSGDTQEIIIGSGLTMTGTTLSASGTGDVSGPAIAVDGDAVVFDGVTGKLIKSAGRAPALTFTGFTANRIIIADGTGQLITNNANLLYDAVTGITAPALVLGISSASGPSRFISADGSATDVNITLVPKGAGAVQIQSPTLRLRNVANTFNGSFTNTNTADRIYTLKDADGTIAFTSDITTTYSQIKAVAMKIR